MKRAIERSKLDRETNIELVETMWNQFSNLGIYELNVIDTTTHSIKDTVSAVKEKIVSGTALLFQTIPVYRWDEGRGAVRRRQGQRPSGAGRAAGTSRQ